MDLTGNGANDYLLSVAPKVQAVTLAKIVGGNCRGQIVFYSGFGKSGFAKDKAFWSLRCADGRLFMVTVESSGSGSVLEYEVLKALKAGWCFKTLSD